MPAGIRTSKPF